MIKPIKIRIPKDGMLAKVIWVDVTAHNKMPGESGRSREDMVKKCNIGLVKRGAGRVIRIISEWEIDEDASLDSYEVILTKDAIEEIIPLEEKK